MRDRGAVILNWIAGGPLGRSRTSLTRPLSLIEGEGWVGARLLLTTDSSLEGN